MILHHLTVITYSSAGIRLPSAPHPLHLGGDVAIGVQGEACGIMSKQTRQGLHIHAILEGQCSEGVPLRYNYDKPEKPRISRVFGYQARFFILFQPEKSSREVVIS